MRTLQFKTSVKRKKDAANLTGLLKTYFDLSAVTIDTNDRQKVLSVQGNGIIPQKIEQALTFLGFQCKLLV